MGGVSVFVTARAHGVVGVTYENVEEGVVDGGEYDVAEGKARGP